MKTRRHHNNTGLRQIKRGETANQVEAMARRILGRPSIIPCPRPYCGGQMLLEQAPYHDETCYHCLLCARRVPVHTFTTGRGRHPYSHIGKGGGLGYHRVIR